MNHPRVGWTCPQIPLELFSAAGVVPVRASTLSDGVHLAEPHLTPRACGRTCRILQAGLEGKAEVLAGLVLTNACDGMRRLQDAWVAQVPTIPSHVLQVPRKADPEGISFFASKLESLYAWLCDLSGANPSRTALASWCRMHAAKRVDLQKRLSAAAHGSGASGETLTGACLDDLDQPGPLVAELRQASARSVLAGPAAPRPSPRILLSGGCIEDPALERRLIASGGHVVAIDTCMGARLCAGSHPESRCSFHSLAETILERPSCVRQVGLQGRIERLFDLVAAEKAHGIVWCTIDQCDYCMLQAPSLIKAAQSRGIPVLALELDSSGPVSERLAVRVDAFVEMLSGSL